VEALQIVNLNESMRRLAKFNGVKVNSELRLKECEWWYHKTEKQLYKELIVLLKSYWH